MDPSFKVPNLFHVPTHPWPVVNRGSVINRVQKILKPNHVTGVPANWPKIYYGQTRANLNLNRTYRNTNVADLPDGAYLYLIEYSPSENRYYKSFVMVLNKLESGSRHFQLPTGRNDRLILAAGELSKRGTKVIFNLESGTYTKNLINKTIGYMAEANTANLVGKNKREVVEAKFVRVVKNALRSARPNVNITVVKNILVPNIPGSLQNLLARGNLSFYHGTPTNKTRNRIMASLKNAGLATNNATNLIRRLVAGEKFSPPTATPAKRARANNTNGGVVRRGGRRPPVPRS